MAVDWIVPPEKTDETPAGPRAGEIVGAIPARWGSSRLPGKPLRELAGRPLIEHVWRRVSRARRLARAVVLTDDERIARAVEGFGGVCEMTPADCASGTDRIAWAARRWPAAVAVVNVQGDEPLIDPKAVDRLAAHLAAHPEDPVVTLAAPAGPEDHGNPDVVKVVMDAAGRALYFSRAQIPYPRGEGGAPARRHLGIYGYQRAALLQWAALEPTPLERSEALEQLRALENGLQIRVLEVERAWPGVDTEADLERIEALIRAGEPGGEPAAGGPMAGEPAAKGPVR